MLSGGWCYSFQLKDWAYYALFTFFATIAVYNFQRLIKIKTHHFHNQWLQWVNQHARYLWIATIISTLTAGILFFSLLGHPLIIIPLFVVASLISYYYVNPIFNGQQLRELPFIKTPLIALVWCAVLLLFPLINERIFTLQASIQVLGFFCYFLALTIPFDIRDLQLDSDEQQTIPQVTGINNAKYLAFGLIITFYFIIAQFNPKMRYNWIFLTSNLIGLVLIAGTNLDRKESWFAAIDASIGITGLAYLIG